MTITFNIDSNVFPLHKSSSRLEKLFLGIQNGSSIASLLSKTEKDWNF